MNPTVTSLQCGHGNYTTSGNVSHHSTGTAVDIAAINGVPILGHQEPGGVTDQAVRAIMTLQGAMAPAQIISLLDLGGPTFAMGDHHDHIHVGYQPGEDTAMAVPGRPRAPPRRSSRRASGTRSSAGSARSATRGSRGDRLARAREPLVQVQAGDGRAGCARRRRSR